MLSLKNNYFIFRTNSFQQCPSWHVRAWVTFGLFAIYQKFIVHLTSTESLRDKNVLAQLFW